MNHKILYLECKTGAAGDMLMGALYSLLNEAQQAEFLEKINRISEEVTVEAEEKIANGIGGTHMCVKVRGHEEGHHDHDHHHDHEHHHDHDHHHEHDHHHDHEHHHDHDHHHHDHHTHSHTSYHSVLEQISHLQFGEEVGKNAAAVYALIGNAESKVHRTSIDQIHFHEVGTLDALVDVVGCCLILDMIKPDEIIASPVCVGNGTVRCAHGVLPVPAPATAEIVKGMPVYTSTFDGELLTPTGAALLKHFVSSYKKDVNMVISEIGYGMGTKNFAQPTFVRAFIGELFDEKLQNGNV